MQLCGDYEPITVNYLILRLLGSETGFQRLFTNQLNSILA